LFSDPFQNIVFQRLQTSTSNDTLI
jgi:hypothetical protein